MFCYDFANVLALCIAPQMSHISMINTHMSIIVLTVVDVNYASYTVYERSFKGESFVVAKSKNTICENCIYSAMFYAR